MAYTERGHARRQLKRQRRKNKSGLNLDGSQQSASASGGRQAEDSCLRDKIAVVVNACEIAAKHYDDYYRSFVALDGKAQNSTTVSGLVIAATALFVKDGRIPAFAAGNVLLKILCLLPAILALASVLIGQLGSRIVDVVVPFDAPEQIAEARGLAKIDCGQFTQEHILDFYRARLRHWEEALTDVHSKSDGKAYWTALGQKITFAALCALILVYLVVLAKG